MRSQPNDAAGDRPPRPPVLWALAAAAVLFCLAYLAAARVAAPGGGLPLDDSWIHLVIARNLAAGEALSINPGEAVAASTAPLWSALVALLAPLPGGPVLPVQLLGMALFVAALHAVWTLARELGLGAGAVYLATAWTAATSWLIWSAVSGLEIPLFVLLTIWGMTLHLRERRRPEAPPRSLAVLALAVLARPEGLLLLLLAGADRALRLERTGANLALRLERRGLARGLALALLILAPVALIHLWASGSVLPTTFAAKASGARGWLPESRYLHSILAIFFRPHPIAVLFAGAGVAALVARLGGRRDRGLLPALWLLGLPLAYSALSPRGAAPLAGSFGRYYFPLFPVLAVVAALGLERAGRTLGPALAAGRLRLPARALLVALILAPTLLSLARGAGRYAQSVANVEASDVRMARWLGERLPPDAVLAVNDVGALKYFLPGHRLLDLAGIATPEALEHGRRALARGEPVEAGFRRFLEARRPDFLVIFPDWYPGLLGAGTGFEALHRLEIPHNITMGSDVLVVASTPWTRAPLGAAGDAGS